MASLIIVPKLIPKDVANGSTCDSELLSQVSLPCALSMQSANLARSFDCQLNIPLIAVLLSWRRPRDIARLVISMIVDAMNTPKSWGPFWEWRSISNKRGKGNAPLITNSDATSAPIGVAATFGIIATLLDILPNTVQRMERFAALGPISDSKALALYAVAAASRGPVTTLAWFAFVDTLTFSHWRAPDASVVRASAGGTNATWPDLILHGVA